MRRALSAFLLALGLAFVLPLAQYAAPAYAQEAAVPSLEAWEEAAARAEQALSENRATTTQLETLRAQIADWRTRLTTAQSANSSRIDILRNQIDSLGPPPAEGANESPQIAARRAELNDQLAQLQAPSIAAVEALSRSEAIIVEIDRRIRERQASALLKLSPTPLNPINWPAGVAVLTQGLRTLGQEVSDAWSNPARRTDLRNRLPVIVLYLAVAILLVWRGTGFMQRLTVRARGVSLRARALISAIVSLGQIAVPTVGTVLLVAAIEQTGMIGPRSGALLQALPYAALIFFGALWLGSWLFPDPAERAAPEAARLTDRPAEGRFLVTVIGLIMAVEAFRIAFTTEVRPPLSQAAQAVWAAPLVMVVSIFLFRLGMLLRRQQRDRVVEGEALLFRNRLIALTGTAAAVVAVVAPILAAIGYVAAANALIWPTVRSLALIGAIILAQRFATDIYLIVTRGDESRRDALIPVLAGFLLSLLSLPVFALIWGARRTDLVEVWQRFVEGVSIGGTRISPAAFLTFAAVFVVGYMLTRLVQGALKSSVLPRTTLEKGVQNAVGAGVGYLGIFLAALIAINAAGIDLSSLAIVAGALSVGIGFGLQNIVSNFVSGIILLIERPISEGDLIEVGGKTGVVRAISVRSTRIETFDRTDVIVPNADLVSGVVTNWTRTNRTGRLVMPVTVPFGTDMRRAQQLLQEIAEAQPLAMLDPKPSVGIIGSNLDGVMFEIRIILADLDFKGDLQTELYHDIMERFAAEDIGWPSKLRDQLVAQEVAAAAARKAAEAAPPVADPATPPRPKRRPKRRQAPAEVDLSRVRNDPDEGTDPDRR